MEKRKSEPVRVLHLTSSLMVGGAERLLVDLLAQNARQPDSAQLCYAVMNSHWDPSLRRELEAGGAEGVFLERAPGDKSPRHLAALSRLVRRWDIQVVHTHTTGSKYWAFMLKMLHPGLRLFYTIHSTFDVVRYRGPALWLHRGLIHENIAVSNAVLAQCRQRGLRRATLVYNGVDSRKYTFRPPALPPGSPVRLVCVSRILPAVKGQDLILEAVALCRQRGFAVQVDLVGDTGGESAAHVAALRERQRQLCLPDEAVRFLGQRDDVPVLLSHYDGCLCASRKEGLGLSILEAMLAGVPVIAPDIDGPAELIEHARTGFLFTAGSAQSLAECMAATFGGGVDLAAAAQAARQFAQKFDISVMAARYTQRYQLCVGAQPDGARSRETLETAG